MPKQKRQAQFGDKWDTDGWKEFFHTSWGRKSFLLMMPCNLNQVTLSKSDALALRDALTKFLETV